MGHTVPTWLTFYNLYGREEEGEKKNITLCGAHGIDCLDLPNSIN